MTNDVIVLHALPRAGKDTLAGALHAAGYTPVALGAPLYAEVAAAFDHRENILRNAESKDKPFHKLALRYCEDPDYVERMVSLGHTDVDAPRSPRWHLEQWGTEYRRNQNPSYWGDKLRQTCSGIEGPIVLTDMRIDDYEIAQSIAADRGVGLIVFGITRPDSPYIASDHSSTELWGPDRITFPLVNVEDEPDFMISDAFDALAGHYKGTTTRGALLLEQRKNLARLWNAAADQQDALNQILDPEWLTGGNPYAKAFAKEATEIMDHQGWEWWKPSTFNRRQIVVELADMLCFGLSHALADTVPPRTHTEAPLAKFISSHMPMTVSLRTAGSAAAVDGAIGVVVYHALAQNTINWAAFGNLATLLGVSRFEVFTAFFAKVALNQFRWANGYREGTYAKTWTDRDGTKMEDNEFMWSHIDEWAEHDVEGMYEAMIAGTFTQSIRSEMEKLYAQYGK